MLPLVVTIRSVTTSNTCPAEFDDEGGGPCIVERLDRLLERELLMGFVVCKATICR